MAALCMNLRRLKSDSWLQMKYFIGSLFIKVRQKIGSHLQATGFLPIFFTYSVRGLLNYLF